MFIDGGSTDVKQVGKYRILPFLKAKKECQRFLTGLSVIRIPIMCPVLRRFLCPDTVWSIWCLQKQWKKKQRQKSWQNWPGSHGTKVLYMQAGDTVRSKRAAMRCLYPKASDKAEDVNDLCLVLQFEEGDISALFGGDISTDVEEQLLRRRKWDKVLVF